MPEGYGGENPLLDKLAAPASANGDEDEVEEVAPAPPPAPMLLPRPPTPLKDEDPAPLPRARPSSDWPPRVRDLPDGFSNPTGTAVVGARSDLSASEGMRPPPRPPAQSGSPALMSLLPCG